MRRSSLRLWTWFIHLPRLVLGALLAQVGLIAGLMAYSALRKRSADEPFPHLKFPPVPMSGHSIQVFDYGAAVFADMLAEIEQAQKLILLETYIFQRDAVGLAFKRALIRKARQGVKVYVVFDGVGSFHVPARFKSFGRRKNIRVFEFGRLRSLLSLFKRKQWIRDHRKILVVDNKVAYLGGMNIGREYASTWRDTHLKVSGSQAATVAQAFTHFWNDNNPRRKLPVSYTLADDPCLEICVNDPLRNDFPIRQQYLDAITSADRNIYITNAYFAPDQELTAALLAAAARGVDVQILVPFISDNIVVDWVVRGSLLTYLRGGVRIFLYEGTILHSKSMTVDGRWSTVGSANLDSLSMHINYEINAWINEEAFARQMEAMFLNDRTHCREALADAWGQRNPLQQLGELALQPLRPLL